VLAFVGAVVLVSSLASSAGAGSGAPDLWLYGRHTTVGEGIISATAHLERLSLEVSPSNDRWVTIAVRNRSSEEAAFDVSATMPSAPFAATFEADGQDVTDAIASGTYRPTIRAGKRLYVYAQVSAAADAQTGQSSEIRITGTPAGGGAADQVRILLSVPPIRVWGVDYTGSVRCEATFPLRLLQPGYETHVRFRVTNLTDHDVSVYGFGTLRFLDASGTELWSSQPPWEGPFWGATLRPGQSKRMYAFDARVRWSGLLTVVPECGGLRLHMPHVVLPVAQPGAPSTVAAAIDAAVAVPGSPFQACPPGPTGSATTGSFTTPDGRDVPPLTLRCWAEVTQEQGFDVVSLQLVSPSDAPDYTIAADSGAFGAELPGSDNMLASRWDFVVTGDSVRPFLFLMQSRAMGTGRSYDYELHDGEWTSGGWAVCGHWEYAASMNGEYLILDWITGCDQSASPTPTPTPAPAEGSSAGTTTVHVGRQAVIVRRSA
jgi:hypothetical protein